MLESPEADEIVALALAEDLGLPIARFLPGPRAASPSEAPVLARDVTSESVVPPEAGFDGLIVAREDCVVCGLPLASRVYEMLAAAAAAPSIEVFPLVAEGADVRAGDALAEVSGNARVVLAGERVALDFLMLLSGIATIARRWQTEAGPSLAVCDTRKTYPGMRALSKYAVRVGGATNHREGLWDMVLVKDNHLRRAGGVTRAVEQARSAHPDLRLEVEADSVEQAAEACRTGADIVLLDNMDDSTLAAAVNAIAAAAAERGRPCLTEASGGVTLARLPVLASLGIDRVSSSALTLAPSVDIGLDETGEERAG